MLSDPQGFGPEDHRPGAAGLAALGTTGREQRALHALALLRSVVVRLVLMPFYLESPTSTP